MALYKMQIIAHNNTAHHILKNEVDFLRDEKVKEAFLAQLFLVLLAWHSKE